MPPDVAEPLDDDAASLERDAEVARILHHHVHDPSTGGLFASERAAQRDRLPGDGRGRVAVAAGVFVEDPGHHLRVGGDVRRRNVAVRPEHDGNALREAAREALQLEFRELLRIHGHAALRAAERDVHERRFPRHDGGETQYLVVVRLGMVADSPLTGAARAVVLDPKAREHLDPSVVRADWNFHLDFAERPHEDTPHVLIEVDQVGGALELAVDDRLSGHRARGQRSSYWLTRRRLARRAAGCWASDNAWATFARRARRPVESASTPITSAPVTAGSGRCSSTNTRPAACSATAVVRVDHPVSAGWGRWATTNGQAAGSNPVRVTSGAPSASARVRQTGRAGPSATTWPKRQPESRVSSTNAAVRPASSGTAGASSEASTTVPVSANQRSAGVSPSGRRGA